MRKEDLKDWTMDRLKDEIVRLQETIRTQKNKISELQKELDEEKGNVITISDETITMRVDMYEAKNENMELKAVNKELKQQLKDLEYAFKIAYKPGSAESVMRKTGLFSEEFIQESMRMNEAIEKDVRKTILMDGSISEKDKLIAELQDQHQQDCIRINDLRTAYLITVDELAKLREQFGVGR